MIYSSEDGINANIRLITAMIGMMVATNVAIVVLYPNIEPEELVYEPLYANKSVRPIGSKIPIKSRETVIPITHLTPTLNRQNSL